MESSLSTSASLIVRVQQHDAEAWRRLTVIYGPVVYQWARRTGLQAHDAADIVQQVFQTLTTGIGKYQRQDNGPGFRAWLWTVYRSRLMDFYRQQKQRPDQADAAWWQSVEDPLSSEQEDTATSQAENRLMMRGVLQVVRGDFSEKTWQAFWRSTVLGEPTQSIAVDLQMTAPAVCMCRSRVLRRVRETIAGLGLLPEDSAEG